MSFTVTLIRHGETDFNQKNLCHTSSPGTLNSAGVEQAKTTGTSLKGTPVTRVYSSDAARCQDTAKEVLAQMGCSIPISTDERLREHDMAEWDGRPMDELKKMAMEFKGDLNSQMKAPSGETVNQVVDRVTAFFMDLLKKRDASDKDVHVLIFSHGLTMQYMLRHFHKNPDKYDVDNFKYVPFVYAENCAKTQFTVGKVAGSDSKRKIVFNCHYDVSHL